MQKYAVKDLLFILFELDAPLFQSSIKWYVSDNCYFDYILAEFKQLLLCYLSHLRCLSLFRLNIFSWSIIMSLINCYNENIQGCMCKQNLQLDLINIKSGDEKLHFSPYDALFSRISFFESFFFKFIAFYGLVSLEICDINSIAFYDLMHLEICSIHGGSKMYFLLHKC